MEIDLADEYTYIKNLVSGKPIIATTFSDMILSHPDIKMFLTSLITEINTGSCDTDMMKRKLNNHYQNNWKYIRKII